MAITILGNWLRDRSQGEPFGNARRLSLDSDLSPNTVSNIIDRGRSTPDALVKIAKSLKVSPVQLFILAEWITEEDVLQYNSDGALEFDEVALLQNYRATSEDGKAMMRAMGEEFVKTMGAS